MGGLCCSAPDQGSVGFGPRIKLYGDYVSIETRTLMAIMKHCEVKFDFELVDSFKKEQKSPAFQAKNPAASIPLLTHNSF